MTLPTSTDPLADLLGAEPRLVLLVRGATSTGKSWLVKSMAEAGLGRLLVFDTEDRARLLPGAGRTFDVVPVRNPRDLPAYIDRWVGSEAARARGIGCYALDSLARFYGALRADLLLAVHERAGGDPTAAPTAEEEVGLQVRVQHVLHRLCAQSGANVVLTDQIHARGKEAAEDRAEGRITPLLLSGAEYVVDVIAELALEYRDEQMDEVRVLRIVKTNTEAFTPGEAFINPDFAMLLERMKDYQARQMAEPLAVPATEALPPLTEALPEPPAPPAPADLTLAELLAIAEQAGVRRGQVEASARRHHGVDDLTRLTAAQRADLHRRLLEFIAREQAKAAGGDQPAAPNGAAAPKAVAATRVAARPTKGG
jgi:hypothetical protein